MKASLANRLMLASSAVIAAVLVSAWWTHRSLSEAEFAARRLSDRSMQAIELSATLERLMHERSRLSDYVLSGDRRFLDAVRPHRQEFDVWIVMMQRFVRTGEERQLLDRMRNDYRIYAAKVDEVIQLQQQGRADEARDVFVSVAGTIEDLLANGQHLFALSESAMRRRQAHTDEFMQRQRVLVSWLTALGAILSLVLAFVLSRYVTRPIYQLVLRLGASGIVDSVRVEGDELHALEQHVTALLERVRQQEHALQQAEKLSELGEIATQIAHETLNPLAGVKGMLQALRRTTLPREAMLAELAGMERELARIEDTVRRLMDYARPLAPRLRPVRVGDVLAAATRAARLAPGARGHLIETAASGVDGLEWPMDPDLMERVLVNLLVNGCEASVPGTPVELRAEVGADTLTFVVRDRGSGIAPAIRDRLFHPFFTTKAHGNGLGLAVSRNIVHEHRGRIEAAAAEGGGTVFRVILPDGGGACASPS
jgi:signal transduction histidine kinase